MRPHLFDSLCGNSLKMNISILDFSFKYITLIDLIIIINVILIIIIILIIITKVILIIIRVAALAKILNWFLL